MAKKTMAAILVLLLLPYFITNFFSGDEKQEYMLQKASKNFISIRIDGEIREISFEDYVMGIAARQIDTDMAPETIKAQVVIARTNLKKQQEDHPGELLSEDYLTLAQIEKKGIAAKMMQAVEETKDQVLTYEGNLIYLPYHAVSSGKTRSGEVMGKNDDYTWLVPVDSNQDVESEKFLDIELLKEEQIRKCIEDAYPDALTDDPLMSQIELVKRDESNYVLQVLAGDQKIPGEKFREILDLNSSCFYIEETDQKIRITTKGLGHGLGFSQYGGEKMALAGKKYAEILQYYFPKCIIV